MCELLSAKQHRKWYNEFIKIAFMEDVVLEYSKAVRQDADEIYQLVQKTITVIYPRYYPKEVVDFFCGLHCRQAIAREIEEGNIEVLKLKGRIIGTGSYRENHITRVYVHPDFQGQGHGSFIMDQLEREIGAKYDTVDLDASLPACRVYEKRGYVTLKHERHPVENKAVLVYEIMQKQLAGVELA